MKIYRTNWKEGPLITTILLLIGIGFAFFSPHFVISDPWVIGICGVIVCISINGFWGTYILIDDHGVYAIDYFLYRNGLAFDQITGVFYHPTWGAGTRARSLSISALKNNKSKRILLGTNHFYSTSTIAAIIDEIRGRMPNVHLDQAADELASKAL